MTGADARAKLSLVHHKSTATRWVTTTDLARYLGVHPRTVIRWARRGALRARAVELHYTDDRPRRSPRRQLRVFEDDLLAFLRRLRGAAVKLPAGLLRG